ncbi:hypothetical protein ACIQZD_10100 [Peribacillus sp. NPDC096447]|uniref:hypothetical protein n=1 Tax=Peribacillus sp. NPDC096447 TaxID=3364394 RepID=UPI003828D57E
MKDYRHKMGMASVDDMCIFFNCNILTDDRKLNTSKGEPKRLRVNSSNCAGMWFWIQAMLGSNVLLKNPNKKAGL